MASEQSYVDFLTDQMSLAGAISFRKMFGEYALYCDGKIFALVCNNQLFIKPTNGGRTFIGNPIEAPAYNGAKNSFLVEDEVEDAAWLCDLVRITVKELPEPKPKKKKAPNP